MLRLIVVLGYLALTVYAITDVIQQSEPRPRGLPKWLWVAAIIVLPFAGAIAWLVLKFLGGDDGSQRRGPRAPDDDPEYLAWLEQQDRRRRREDGAT